MAEDRVGPYRIEGPLGSGGMGEVVVAYDERLDRRVAIKRIRHRPGTAGDDAAERERFRREARAAAGLSHPAIVQIHDVLSHDDGDAIVMELVEGESVAELLRAGPLPVSAAVRLAREVAEGLAEAHARGVVHRDLKAENVMVTPAGHAKILDFGLAKRSTGDEETLTRSGALLGTLRAMSPEQAGGRPVDHRSDLFSLGVLLYEMTTGVSPFRGAGNLETLRRVLTEEPRPLRELRSDAPVELEGLVARLLEKDPLHRPADALVVARALEDLAAGLTADSVPPPVEGADSLSDVPTGSLEVTGSPPAATTASRSSAFGLARRGRWGLAAVVGGVLIVLGAGFLLHGGRPEPLRVAVPRPEIAAAEPSEELQIVASGVLIAALETLSSLEGIAPVEPGQIGSIGGTPLDVARAVAADEVLTATLEPRTGYAVVMLRRIRGDDGEILWTRHVDAPLRATAARLVAEATAVQIRDAYPGRTQRSGVPRLEAEDEDYAAFVRVSRRLESGAVSWSAELRRLEAITASSPRFLEAQLTAASVALTLYRDTREADYLDLAEAWIRRARRLAPEDESAIRHEMRLALARGDDRAAEAALAELLRVAPNSVEVELSRSELAERRGDLRTAEAAMGRAVERWPTWQLFNKLATLRDRRGDAEGARRALETSLERAPDNAFSLGKLARLELRHGDLDQAERLFRRVIEIRPHRASLTNLGLTYFLLERYQEARTAYLRALELAPGHMTVRLNLADTELALGHREAAETLYREILDDLDGPADKATDRMTVAQCLARLGERRRAVATALETLQEHPEHSEIAYQAALVYALVGETTSALVHVEKAAAGGVRPRWFRIPGFESLKSDPGFRALIEAGDA